ncbi:MAG: TIGR04376 family protein [Prochlorothrix sp.]|nr:TIGR04376 family protein [Prochlorothrix sp.]
MSLFDDFSQFLESRLDEFLRNNPHLELQALEEQLREQEADAQQLLREFQAKEKHLQDQILETAKEVQRWHLRIQKAQAAHRLDLVNAAQEREAALLRQGNQLWGQMKGVTARIQRTQELHQQIQVQRQEVARKAAEARKAQAQAAQASSAHTSTHSTTRNPQSHTSGNTQAPPPHGSSHAWSSPPPRGTSDPLLDPLEEQFQQLETDAELQDLKTRMGQP